MTERLIKMKTFEVKLHGRSPDGECKSQLNWEVSVIIVNMV